MVPLRRWADVLGFEVFAMLTAILGLGAASRMTWKAIDVAGRPLELRKVEEIEPIRLRPRILETRTTPVVTTQPVSLVVAEPARVPLVAPLSPPRLKAIVPRPLANLPALPREVRRVRVGTEDGQTVVARVYGGDGSRVVVLPDGQLGWPNEMVYTNEAFRPDSADDLAKKLQDGPYRHFGLVRTEHYLVFHTGSAEFAKRSSQLLESLYRGLIKKFSDLGLAVHDAEFPLVAVIFRNESEFRDHQAVANDIQAYYEVVSNQILFFQDRDRDPEAPENAAMRKPETVLHEGTHQILMNIGVQPRLAAWPAWLTEGLAEYATPIISKTGEWEGFGRPNPLHLATIQELDDTLALQGRSARLTRNRVGRALGWRTVADLLVREKLSPTDYAVSWGLTHFLVSKKADEFVAYLKELSELSPLADPIPGEEARRFRRRFGDDLPAMGQALHKHLCGLKRPDPLPYYTVIFEQPIGEGLVRRGTMVSQSPLMIRQWLETMSEGFEAPFVWRPYSYASRTAAFAAAETWIQTQ